MAENIVCMTESTKELYVIILRSHDFFRKGHVTLK